MVSHRGHARCGLCAAFSPGPAPRLSASGRPGGRATWPAQVCPKQEAQDLRPRGPPSLLPEAKITRAVSALVFSIRNEATFRLLRQRHDLELPSPGPGRSLPCRNVWAWDGETPLPEQKSTAAA